MMLIQPVPVTESTLISSNVDESEYPTWLITNAFAKGDRVIYLHKVYEALGAIPANTAGSTPGAETIATGGTARWLLVGYDNRWRMFDDKIESQTTRSGTIVVVIRPGAVVNGISMFNVSAKTVNIKLTDPVDGVVYNKTIKMVDPTVSNWYDYFFTQPRSRGDFVQLDLPTYGSADITLTIDAGTGTAGVGHVAMGLQQFIGEALYGSSVGIIDYSRKTTDDFGNTTVTKRSYSNRAEFDVWIDTYDVTRVKKILTDLRSTPVVWVGSEEENYEATVLFGYYKDFSMIFTGPEVSDCSITVEAII